MSESHPLNTWAMSGLQWCQWWSEVEELITRGDQLCRLSFVAQQQAGEASCSVERALRRSSEVLKQARRLTLR
jgi:hypothetical protein